MELEFFSMYTCISNRNGEYEAEYQHAQITALRRRLEPRR